MKPLFENEITIKKIIILKRELDNLIKERDKNQNLFDNLCDNIDRGINGDYVNSISAILSAIMDKTDAIHKKLNALNKTFTEIRSQLMN